MQKKKVSIEYLKQLKEMSSKVDLIIGERYDLLDILPIPIGKLYNKDIGFIQNIIRNGSYRWLPAVREDNLYTTYINDYILGLKPAIFNLLVRIKEPVKRIPLESKDINIRWILKRKNDDTQYTIVTKTIDGVIIFGKKYTGITQGVFTIDAFSLNYKILMDKYLISKNQGRTWKPISKEVKKEEIPKEEISQNLKDTLIIDKINTQFDNKDLNDFVMVNRCDLTTEEIEVLERVPSNITILD